ncbi:MAG: AAA family ATPase [Thermomicrobiales bacterium]
MTQIDIDMPNHGPIVVLITGMSGTGKSTTLDELARRGWRAVDTDYDDWQVAGPDGDPMWDEPKIASLLDSLPANERLALSGTVRNQGRFRHRFAAIVLLTAPLDVMLQRVTARTANPYGSTAADRHAIARDTEWVLPLLRESADIELDTGTQTVSEIADRISAFIGTR